MKTTHATLEWQADAELGEGPLWDDKDQKLYWVDIVNGILFEYEPLNRSIKTHAIGGHVGAAALREKGGMILATEKGFAFYDLITQEVTHIVDPEASLPGNRFNDGKCDPAGRFWAGTMAYSQTKGAGNLYSLHTDLQVKTVLQDITISNGMAWNKHEDLFFFIDTPTLRIECFDYNKLSGDLSNRTTKHQFKESEGYPDGMCIDSNDNLWVALYGGGKVVCIDSDNGQMIHEIQLPVPKPTSCTFGGRNLDELYITTCRDNMSSSEIEKYQLSGSLFKVKLSVTGLQHQRFKG